MPIRDLDDPSPKEVPIPVEEVADEILFMLGRIRDLFSRVYARKKAQWDPATRTRQPMNKIIAEITDEDSIEKAWELVEQDALAHYKAGAIECFIVRYADEKYACEILDNGRMIDAIVKRRFDSLARYLLETYPAKGIEMPVMESPPVIVKKKPGRPPKVAVEQMTTAT